jgi:hypothetical protein
VPLDAPASERASKESAGFSCCSAWWSRPERNGRTTSVPALAPLPKVQRTATTPAARAQNSSWRSSPPPSSRKVQVGQGSAVKAAIRPALAPPVEPRR